MADWKRVRRIVRSLPETSESALYGAVGWYVRKKLFAWERPLRASDLKALGKKAPTGPILAVRVEHLLAKDAKLTAMRAVCFTIPHFDGYPAILVRLPKIAARDLEALVVDAWLARAPKTLVRKFLENSSRSRR